MMPLLASFLPRVRAILVGVACVLVLAGHLDAQQGQAPVARLGLDARMTRNTQVGPVLSIDLARRGPVTAQLEAGAMWGTTLASQFIGNLEEPKDHDRRGATFVSFASLGAELARWGDDGREAFVRLHGGVTVVRWGPGRWSQRYPSDYVVNPEGTSTVAPSAGLAWGLEFPGLGTRMRATVSIDQTFDRVAGYRAVRVGFARTW